MMIPIELANIKKECEKFFRVEKNHDPYEPNSYQNWSFNFNDRIWWYCVRFLNAWLSKKDFV